MTTTITSRRTRAFIALAVGATAVVSLLVPVLAQAAQIDDKRKQAEALEADIEANGVQLSAMNEQIKTAEDKLAGAEVQIADAQARIDRAKAEMQRIEKLVRQRAASIYRSSANGGDAIDIFDLDIRTLTSREQYSSAASDKDNSLLDDLDAARDDLADTRQDAEGVRRAATDEKATLDARKAEFEKAQAERQALLDQVTGELETLVAEAAAVREAAVAAENVPPPVSALPPAGSGGAGAAVSYAYAQLGKPYCYAGTGPACYDCSGLTSMAWQAGGLTIPRTSGGQGAAFPSVPLDQLQPGDLITTSSWGAHVGIWVGGGYIHATHTGDFIRYVAGVDSVNAAVRPG